MGNGFEKYQVKKVGTNPDPSIFKYALPDYL